VLFPFLCLHVWSHFFLLSCFPCSSEAVKETEEGGIVCRTAALGGIYRIPLLNEPPTLDPAFVVDSYGMSVVQQIFDGLVQFSPESFCHTWSGRRLAGGR